MITMNLPKIMIVCLICTIIIELLVALILGTRNKKDFLNIILVNIFTNPIVSVIPFVIGLKYGLIYRNVTLIFLEIFTFISEGFIYKKILNYKKINGYILSLNLNLSSYLIGTLINTIIW